MIKKEKINVIRTSLIKTDLIDVSYEGNIRHRQALLGLDELINSIRAVGLIQPLLVQKSNSRYELIAGQRRLKAVQTLRWKKVLCTIIKPMNLINAKIASLSENLYRRQLDPEDTSDVCYSLKQELGSVAEVAKRLGVTEKTVRKYIGYYQVDKSLKKSVKEKRITVDDSISISLHAKGDLKKQQELAAAISKLPKRKSKDKVLEQLKRTPYLSSSKIVSESKKLVFKDITIHLTPSGAVALQRACKMYKKEAEELAKEALENWLTGHGFPTE